MLSIDPWNILWTVVNLLVLYLVFKKFLFKPVMKVINAREDMIKQQFDDAKNIATEKEKATEAAQADIARLALIAARKIVKTGDAHDAGSSK